MTDTDQKSAAELRAERFDDLRSEWNRLSSRTSLGQVQDELEDVAGRIEALPSQIADLRSRGYRYSRAWEGQAEALSENWPRRRQEARRIRSERVRSLRKLAQEIERLCDQSTLSGGGLNRLEDKLERLESQVDGAERDVRGAYDSLNEQLYELEREFRSVERMLELLDTASFDLYPDENGVAACEATWTNHPEEPEGNLILTDGRLVFEQREKKATKKMLFITTESELVQKVWWEAPVGIVEELEAEDKKKFLSRKELLHLRFREYPSGLHGDVTLHLEGTTNEEWAGLIKRVQSGEIEADRHAAAAGAAAAEAGPEAPPKEIPTKCPACGGKLPTLVKGMQEIVCEYCGTSLRV